MNPQVPFNDTSRVYYENKEALLRVIADVGESGRWLLGDFTTRFAESFANYCNVKYCLPVANGTDALELSLRAIMGNENEGSEVITVANAGGYTSTACRLIGATPVYVDIEESTQLISLKSLENCLGPKVRVVVVTHLYGGVVDVHKIRQLLDDRGYDHVFIIEDCAQAHGAIIHSQPVGSIGDIGTFSFYPTKNLGAMGDAGAIVTNSDLLYRKVVELSQYGWNTKYNVNVSGGRNSRMDEMQAAILSVLMQQLDANNNIRKSICEKYRNAVGANSNLIFLEHGDMDYVAHLAVALASDRERFLAFMKSEGVAVDIHYPILDCDQIAWEEQPKRIDHISKLSVSKASVKKVVSLPCFPSMRLDEISRVCEVIKEWVRS